MKKKYFPIVLVLLMAMFLVGCGGIIATIPTEEILSISSITLIPETMTLVEGDSQSIESITAHYNNGSTINITLDDCTYDSSDIGIATVNTGVITAVAPGIATITVGYTDSGITKTDTMVVSVVTAASFSVQCPEGYETDVSNMLIWANQVVYTLQKSFPDFLDVIDSRILIIIKDTGDPSHASADVVNTSITFIAPSVAAEESDYYDEDYYIGNIAHELGHIYFYRIRNLTSGYLWSNVPSWFHEGFSEYLKLLVLGEQCFDEKYDWYLPEIPNIIAYGIAGISNVYPGGSWILRFIDSKFGINTIKAIITSNQSTFLYALSEATNLTLAQFEEQLKEWLKEWPT